MSDFNSLKENDSDDFKFIRINKRPICLNKDENNDPLIEDVSELKGKNLLGINPSYLAIALQNNLKLVKLDQFDDFLANSKLDDQLEFAVGTDIQLSSEIVYVTSFKNKFWVGLLSGDVFEITTENFDVEKKLIKSFGEGEYKLSADGSYCLKDKKLIVFDSSFEALVDENVIDFECKAGMCLAILKEEELVIRKDTALKNIKLVDLGCEDKDFYYVQILNENFVQLFFTSAEEEDTTIPDYQSMESLIVDISQETLTIVQSDMVASADAFVENNFETYAVELKDFLNDYPNITIISSSRSTSAQLLTETQTDGEGKFLLQNSTDDQFNITLPMNAEDDDTTAKGLVFNLWSSNADFASDLLAVPILKDVPIVLLLNSELELFCYLFVHTANYKSGEYNLEDSKSIKESRLDLSGSEEMLKKYNIELSHEKEQSTDENEPVLLDSNGVEEEFEIIPESEPKSPVKPSSENEDVEASKLIEQDSEAGLVDSKQQSVDGIPKLGILKTMENIVSKANVIVKDKEPESSIEPLSLSSTESDIKKNVFAISDGSPFANIASSNKISTGGLSFAAKFNTNTTEKNSQIENAPAEENLQNETTNLNTTFNTLDTTDDVDDGSWVEVHYDASKNGLPLSSDDTTKSNSSIIEEEERTLEKPESSLSVAEISTKSVNVKPEIVSAGCQSEKQESNPEHVSVFADEKLFTPKVLNEAHPYPVLEKLYAVDSDKVLEHKFESDDAGLIVFGKIINIVENELRVLKGNVKAFDKFFTSQTEKTFEKDSADFLTDSTINWRLGEIKRFNELFFDEFETKKLDLNNLKEKDNKLTEILKEVFDSKNNISKSLLKLSSSYHNDDKFDAPTNSEEGLLESNRKGILSNGFKIKILNEYLKLIKVAISCGKSFENIDKTDIERFLSENTSFGNTESLAQSSNLHVQPFNNQKRSLKNRREMLSRREKLANILK